MSLPRPSERLRPVFGLLVFLALWLDGSFYPLIALPFLFIKLYCKEDLSRIGLGTRRLPLSLALGVVGGILVSAVYYPIHLRYLGRRPVTPLGAVSILTDVVWYPLYEELSYRGFFLGFFAGRGRGLSNHVLNLVQALMFVSVHRHHVSAGFPLLLIPVFLVGFVNGLVFLRSRNVAGCVVGHALLNGLSLLIQNLPAG